MTKLSVKSFEKPLTDISASEEYAVKSVRPVFIYENGVKTDVIESFVYEVVDTVTFDIFEIKVEGTKPVLTQAEVESADERFFVEFENAKVKPYRIEFGKVLCSITADSVKLVK